MSSCHRVTVSLCHRVIVSLCYRVTVSLCHRVTVSSCMYATVTPIVTGERRKATTENNNGKKKYRKKPKDTARLCADDVMTRDNLKKFQDTYAESMQKYELSRGIRGSDAKHIDTTQFYNMVYSENQHLKEKNKVLMEQEQDINNSIHSLYDMRDEAREKFIYMDDYVKKRTKEIANVETHIDELMKEYVPYQAQDDLNLLFQLFPHLIEYMRIAQLCKLVGLTIDATKRLFKGETIIANNKLYSSEHKQEFSVKDGKLQLFKESKDSDKLKLSINGQNILEWFKHRYQENKQTAKTQLNVRKGLRR